VSTGPTITAWAGVAPNWTVCRSRHARRRAGFTIGCISISPVDLFSDLSADLLSECPAASEGVKSYPQVWALVVQMAHVMEWIKLEPSRRRDSSTDSG
jgi:hypothetical protein